MSVHVVVAESMLHCSYRSLSKLGVPFVGVPVRRAPLFKVYVRAPGFGKLPLTCDMNVHTHV